MIARFDHFYSSGREGKSAELLLIGPRPPGPLREWGLLQPPHPKNSIDFFPLLTIGVTGRIGCVFGVAHAWFQRTTAHTLRAGSKASTGI